MLAACDAGCGRSTRGVAVDKEWVLAAVGGGLLLVALGVFLRRRAQLARWVSTPGLVIGYRVRATIRDGRRRTYHHPQVRFEANGMEWVHDSAVGTSQPKWEVGSSVPLVYDPAQPHEACIDTLGAKYFVAMFLGAMGAIFSAVGVALAR